MPRTVEEILNHADDLAKQFEQYEPKPDDERDVEAVAALREAVIARSDAERTIRDAVHEARESGLSWSSIGALVGTSGEAVRQRYMQRHKRTA